jgi:hypothetical protein
MDETCTTLPSSAHLSRHWRLAESSWQRPFHHVQEGRGLFKELSCASCDLRRERDKLKGFTVCLTNMAAVVLLTSPVPISQQHSAPLFPIGVVVNLVGDQEHNVTSHSSCSRRPGYREH